MRKIDEIKNASGYVNYSTFADNGLGKPVDLVITAWQKRRKFELYTSRGMGFCVEGDKAVLTARELIEILQPIADSEMDA